MPYVHVDIGLDDFEDREMIEELESRGYTVIADTEADAKNQIENAASTGGMADLDHIEHLVICGQLDAARAEALQLVSNAIGRSLQ